MILRRLVEQAECLKEIINEHLEPLIDAATAGEHCVETRPDAKKSAGDIQVDGRTMKTIVQCSTPFPPMGISGISGMGYPLDIEDEPEDDDDQEDPNVRYLSVVREIDALIAWSRNQNLMDIAQYLRDIEDYSTKRRKPTKTQRGKLKKILNPNRAPPPPDAEADEYIRRAQT